MPARGAVGAVTIAAYSFEPSPAVVTRGGTLIFVNADATQLIRHDASYPVMCGRRGKPRCRWTTGLLDPGRPAATVTVSLPPGTYTFYCRVHAFMRGTLIVPA